MAEESIGKLMLRFSIPCIMSLLVSALYNIVDQIFIGRGVGFLGNGATNVVFPVTIIALSLSLLVGDGCAAYLSICQGRKDGEHAHRSVGNAVAFIVASGIVLTLLYAFFRDSILWGFGATWRRVKLIFRILRPCGGYSLLWGGSAVHGNNSGSRLCRSGGSGFFWLFIARVILYNYSNSTEAFGKGVMFGWRRKEINTGTRTVG